MDCKGYWICVVVRLNLEMSRVSKDSVCMAEKILDSLVVL